MARFRIGRSDDNDIVVDEQSVSRQHAEVEVLEGGRYRIRDLGSSYGTFVDSGEGWNRVEDAEIGPDDAVKLGDHTSTIGELLAQVVETDPNQTLTGDKAYRAPSASSDAREAQDMASPKPPPPEPPQPAPAPPPASGSIAGIDRRTFWIIAGGGGALLLVVIIIAAAVLVSGPGGGPAATASIYDACIEANPGEQARCNCVAELARDQLTPKQQEFLAFQMQHRGDEERRTAYMSERFSSVTDRIALVQAMARLGSGIAERCGN